jgi:hypothetical protein
MTRREEEEILEELKVGDRQRAGGEGGEDKDKKSMTRREEEGIIEELEVGERDKEQEEKEVRMRIKRERAVRQKG